MQGSVNIIHTLRNVQISGTAPTLEVFTNWDNTKHIQDPPELHIRFERQPVTILQISPPGEQEGEQESLPHATTEARQVSANGSEKMASKRVKRSGKVPAKYIDDVYEVPVSRHVQRKVSQPGVSTTAVKKAVEQVTEPTANVEKALKLKLDDQHKSSAGPQQLTLQMSAASQHSPTSTDSSKSSDSEDSEASLKKKKLRKPKTDYFSRVRTPEDSIKRYDTILELVKKGLTKSEAYCKTRVDRNTIVNQAPIAELAVVNPEMFCALRVNFKKGSNLQKFA